MSGYHGTCLKRFQVCIKQVPEPSDGIYSAPESFLCLLKIY